MPCMMGNHPLEYLLFITSLLTKLSCTIVTHMPSDVKTLPNTQTSHSTPIADAILYPLFLNNAHKISDFRNYFIFWFSLFVVYSIYVRQSSIRLCFQ